MTPNSTERPDVIGVSGLIVDRLLCYADHARQQHHFIKRRMEKEVAIRTRYFLVFDNSVKKHLAPVGVPLMTNLQYNLISELLNRVAVRLQHLLVATHYQLLAPLRNFKQEAPFQQNPTKIQRRMSRTLLRKLSEFLRQRPKR